MVITMVPAFTLTASAANDPVSYLEPVYVNPSDVTEGISGWETKSCSDYTVVDSSTTLGEDGEERYYVISSNITFNDSMTIKGNVKLILMDGCTLSVTVPVAGSDAGIIVASGDSLTVYAQSTDDATMGKLIATGGGSGGAGIGGSAYQSNGTITINGGSITANGNGGGAGIGAGDGSGAGDEYGNVTIVINGGVVHANGSVESNGSNGGAGIGAGGSGNTAYDITINGGTVFATGGVGGAGIGAGGPGGNSASAHRIHINGGTITAAGGTNADAIGNAAWDEYDAEYKPASDNIFISTSLIALGGSENPPSTGIANSGSDLASDLKGKQYVIISVPTPVCSVTTGGNNPATTEYTTIDEAESAWTDGCTLTLLSDVTTANGLTATGASSGDPYEMTLDLNGHVLGVQYTGSALSVVNVSKDCSLTIKDSDPSAVHYFQVQSNGLWKLYTGAVATADYTFDAANGLQKNGEATTDIPAENDIIAVSGGCITEGTWYGINTGMNVVSSQSVTFESGIVIGNPCSAGSTSHPVHVGNKVTFTMEEGSAIVGNTATYGSLYNDYGNVTINGGIIGYNTSNCYNSGAGVYNLGGSITMNGGTIGYNRATVKSSSGAVFNFYGSFTMKDGSIVGNKVVENCFAGGICNVSYYGYEANFTMSGGTISDNEGSKSGAVYNWSYNGAANFTMTGGTISGNTGINSGGVYQLGVMTVGGTAVITGNTSSEGAEKNVVLPSGITLLISADTLLTDGAFIGVSTETAPTGTTPVAISGANDIDYSAYFTADEAIYGVEWGSDNALQLALLPIFDDCFGGEVTKKTYKTWTHDDYTLEGWYYDNEGTQTKLDDSETPVGGVTYTAKWTKGGKTVITEPLSITSFEDASGEGWSWNHETMTLTLDGAVIDCSGCSGEGHSQAILVPSGSAIDVKSDSTLIAGTSEGDGYISAAVGCSGPLTIEGDGKLTVIGGKGHLSSGIFAEGSLTITADVFAQSDIATGSISAGIYSRGAMILAADVTGVGGVGMSGSFGIGAYGTTCLIQSGANVTAKGGENGKYANGFNTIADLTIESGAVVNAYGGNGSVEYYGLWTDGNVAVDGTLNLYGGSKTGTSTNEALFIEADDKLLIISETGTVTADSAIKTTNTAGFGDKGEHFYTVTGSSNEANGTSMTLTPYAGETLEITLVEYTASFEGLTGAEATQVTTGYFTEPAAIPVKEGYSFVGWTTSEPGDYVDVYNFDAAELLYRRADREFYAVWVENTTNLNNSTSTVKDSNDQPVENVWVTIAGNGGSYVSTLSSSSGEFEIKNLPDGIYNIQFWDLNTGKLTVTDYTAPDDNGKTFNLPAENTSTWVIKVSEPALSTVIIGLDQLAAEVSVTGSEVTLNVGVYACDESEYDDDQQQIRDISNSKELSYLDIRLGKIVGTESYDITETDHVLTFIVPYDTTRDNIKVYRYHEEDGEAETLTNEGSKMTEPLDGHFYVDTENDLVYIYASKFSTYAIGYGVSYTTPSTYAVTVSETQNGKLTADVTTARAGKTVTLTVTPDKGYTLETITVVDKTGKEIELTAVKEGESFTFKMPSGKVTVSATFMEDNTMLNFFVDVTADDYYYDAVLWAAENGVTAGVDNLHFGPDKTVTRAQMVTFLWNAAGQPVVNYAMSFTDVSEDAWYAEAVRWAVSEGITAGTSETTFSPNAIVNRAQAVTFLWNAAKAPKFANMTAEGPAPSPFEDVATDAYYYNAVLWAKAQGITSGTSDTTFSPADECIRAQIVTFLYNNSVK